MHTNFCERKKFGSEKALNNNFEKVADFLKNTQMDYKSIDIDENCRQFIEEMKSGLCGNESSLKMIPTYLSFGGSVPKNEPVIVLDAGGTNFRVAVVKFDSSGNPVISNFKIYKMPGTENEISSDEFFETVISYIVPVINDSEKIGVCFSYAAEPSKNMDGTVLEIGKQLKIKNFVGKKIGAGLNAALKRHGISKGKKIIVLNDSAATLLGGKAAAENRIFDGYIGFILGTGTNTCYLEKLESIKKICSDESNGSMIINMETGGYKKFKRSVIDRNFDEKTIDEGRSSFEKMISGKYQGGLLLETLSAASCEDIFSPNFKLRLKTEIKTLNASEIDEFLYYPYGGNRLSRCCDSEEDRRALYLLIDNMTERSARLVLINLVSVMVSAGIGSNPLKPVCITAEGSAFYKSKLFKSKLDYYIRRYMNDKMHLYCDILNPRNVTLVGTAIAALVN